MLSVYVNYIMRYAILYLIGSAFALPGSTDVITTSPSSESDVSRSVLDNNNSSNNNTNGGRLNYTVTHMHACTHTNTLGEKLCIIIIYAQLILG